jgi:hypothetical protein
MRFQKQDQENLSNVYSEIINENFLSKLNLFKKQNKEEFKSPKVENKPNTSSRVEKVPHPANPSKTIDVDFESLEKNAILVKKIKSSRSDMGDKELYLGIMELPDTAYNGYRDYEVYVPFYKLNVDRDGYDTDVYKIIGDVEQRKDAAMKSLMNYKG